MNKNNRLSRREFIKFNNILGLSYFLNPLIKLSYLETFPEEIPMGRVTTPFANVRFKPDLDSAVVKKIEEDTVIEIYREVVGNMPYRRNQVWVETPIGYVWSPILQRVKNTPNIPEDSLKETSLGPGMWVEVSVPWVEVVLDNPTPFGPRIKYLIESFLPIRLYYSQIIWVDQIREDESGQAWYRLSEPHGSYGDRFWGPAEGFRPITPEESSPISPEIKNKRIDISIPQKTLSCFENEQEMYFCLISSGRANMETPIGNYFQTFWKLISVHMSAGTTGAGYDLSGVGWPTFFAPDGIAIHSTFWHHEFGTATSAVCINCLPDDAKFISRWTTPLLP